MKRVDAPEILDSENCPADQVQPTLQTLDRINRWFGGVSITQRMVTSAFARTGSKRLSLLEVAAGSGTVPAVVQQNLNARGLELDLTLLDRMASHLHNDEPQHSADQQKASDENRVVADGLSLPFSDHAFDLVSCNLFAHHLAPEQLSQFITEGLRVSRVALLINDLVRHPAHLALVYASYPIMGSHIAWLDGLTSVRRAYVPEEIRGIIRSATPEAKIEIRREFLFRMGVIVWKE